MAVPQRARDYNHQPPPPSGPAGVPWGLIVSVVAAIAVAKLGFWALGAALVAVALWPRLAPAFKRRKASPKPQPRKRRPAYLRRVK